MIKYVYGAFCIVFILGCAEPEASVTTEQEVEKTEAIDKGIQSTVEENIETPASSSNPVQKKEEVVVEENLYEASADGKLVTGWYLVTKESTSIERLLTKTTDLYPIQPIPILTFKDVKSVQMYQTYASSEVVMGVSMILNAAGKQKYARITKENKGNAIAFVLNDELIYLGKIYGEVGTGLATITRLDYSPEEVFTLKETLTKLVQ